MAFFLLAIVLFGNSPTKFLHDVFADHSDFVNKKINYSNSPQYLQSGVNCHCDNLVVISPYQFTKPILSFRQANNFPVFFVDNINSVPSVYNTFRQLRAPPAKA
jgi:hypothetical protein